MVSLSGIIDAITSTVASNTLFFEMLAFAYGALSLALGIQRLFLRSERKTLFNTLVKNGTNPEEAKKKVKAERPSHRKAFYLVNIIIVTLLTGLFYVFPVYDYVALMIGFLTALITNGFAVYQKGVTKALSVLAVGGKMFTVPLGKLKRFILRKPKPPSSSSAATQPKSPPRKFGAIGGLFFVLIALVVTLCLWAGVLLGVKYLFDVEFTAVILSLPFDNIAFVFLAIGAVVILLLLFTATYITVVKGLRRVINRKKA